MIDFIRNITPSFLLDWYRKKKKTERNKKLKEQQAQGNVLTEKLLLENLQSMGIKEGETLLVHSSMSKMGYLEEGPITIINALRKAVGENGNLLMPTSPSASYTKEYIEENPVFDVLNTPSRMGAISENFRKLEGVRRSLHPTEPVCALGPNAEYLTSGHFGEISPYTKNSPYHRVSEFNGKILMIGVTLDNAGTNLHTLEDAIDDFKFQVYDAKIYDAEVIDGEGKSHAVQTKVHSIEQAQKRQCDKLLPMFEEEGIVTYHQLGKAKCLLLDAKEMFEAMLKHYKASGVTMYTPHGS